MAEGRTTGAAGAARLAVAVLAASHEGAPGRFENGVEDDFDAVMSSDVKSAPLGIKHRLEVTKPQGRSRIGAAPSISGVMAPPLLAPRAASNPGAWRA